MKAVIGCLIGLVFSRWCVGGVRSLRGGCGWRLAKQWPQAQVQMFDMTDLQRGAVAQAMTDSRGYFALPLAGLPGLVLPKRFELGANYPNPFNPSTLIPYHLAASSYVRLEVFNLLGQRIATLVEGERSAGVHTAVWDATDGSGQAVGAGVYLYRLTVGGEHQTGRMVLVDGQAGVSAVGGDGVWPVGIAQDRAYGLVVSGSGIAPYVVADLGIQAGMAPVELVVEAHPAGKALDDDDSVFDLSDLFNTQEEEEEDTAEEAEARKSGPKIEGPWLWMIVSTGDKGGPAASASGIDWLAEGSGGSVTEQQVAQNGAGAGDPVGDKVWTWGKLTPTSDNNITELVQAIGLGHGYIVNHVAYGWIALDAPQQQNTTMYVGSDDAVKVWLNGVLVHDNPADRAASDYQDEFPITLKQGKNSLLVAVYQGEFYWSGFFGFEDDAAYSYQRGPDLVVSSVSASDTTLSSGQAFTLNAKVRNQGDKPSAATTLRYYVSTDATITSDDEAVGTDAIGALNPSAINGVLISLTAPASAGTYYYGVCVESVSGESNTDNNCSRAVTVTVSGSSGTSRGEEVDDTPKEETDDALVTIPDANLRAAIEAALGKVSGATITKAEMTTLTELLIEWGISDLTGLEFATNLTMLIPGVGNITDISALSGLTNLTVLGLSENNITDISALSGLTNLTWLSLGGGDNITDISALSGLTNLTWLSLGSVGNTTDISALSGLTNLTWLDLRFNNITDISALSGLTNLTTLDLKLNTITDVSPLRGLTNLTTLDLRGNPLNVSSINDHIAALEGSGATVLFDSFRLGAFDIELVFLEHFTGPQKRVLEYAARRWMSVITEDLPDYEFTQGWSGECDGQPYEISVGERIDDLRVYVSSFEYVDISSPNAWARVEVLRETNGLPVVGCMTFDLKWSSFGLLDIGTHEIGHTLGFGTVWEDFGFIQDLSADTHFNGPLAIAAFDDAGGWDYAGAKVPVMDDGVHWRPWVLRGEVMGQGGGGPETGQLLSAITVQSLADLGYGVDVTQADPYTLPDAAAKASAKLSALPTQKLSHGVGEQREPIYVVDQQGRIVRTLQR